MKNLKFKIKNYNSKLKIKSLSPLVLLIGVLISANLFSYYARQAEKGDNLYRVKRVIDGDTIVLDNDERVRYIGIDTPELHHPKKPVEYLAREAKEFNEKLVAGKTVRLEFDVQKRDKYNRLLAYVYAGDTFVNAKIIEEGYAQILTIPPNLKYADLFLRLLRKARREKNGLWAD